MNKASGGDGIPPELFNILKDGANKVFHSVHQQIWKDGTSDSTCRAAKETQTYRTDFWTQWKQEMVG